MQIPYVAWPPSLDAASVRSASLIVLLALGCSDESHRLGGQYEVLDGRKLGTCASGADLESVDRMEDGDGTIERISGRGGVWLSFNDGTGEQRPSDKAETFEMHRLSPTRSESHFAARSRGDSFEGWGAGIGFELNNQQPYDLSRYAGITFWARRGPRAPLTVRFSLPDRATAPRGQQCSYACNDHFGADVTLGTEFERYSYGWSALKQGIFGDPKPESIDASAVYAVHFQVDGGQDFDFTIDDIALLCHPE